MSGSADQRQPIEALAEDFLERKRRGERPTLEEYAARHPELADEIRELFPALEMMEHVGDDPGGVTGSIAGSGGRAEGVKIDKLGDYRILREIGRGGMGVVFEAEQESLGRRVALKVLAASAVIDAKQLRRFEREARSAARLHHTNIVPVFGVGRQDGYHYYVMQFIQGQSLDLVLDELRRLKKVGSGTTTIPGPTAARRAGQPAGITGRLGVTVVDECGLSAADVANSLLSGRFEPIGTQLAGLTLAQGQPGEADAAAATAALTGALTDGPTPAPAPIHPVWRIPRSPAHPGTSPAPRSAWRGHPIVRRYPNPTATSTGAWPASACRSPRPSTTPTARASSTATSSPATSSSTPGEMSGSPTSAWPRRPTPRT